MMKKQGLVLACLNFDVRFIPVPQHLQHQKKSNATEGKWTINHKLPVAASKESLIVRVNQCLSAPYHWLSVDAEKPGDIVDFIDCIFQSFVGHFIHSID
nr:hypothetical protein CFP56_43518 [Quercus suber]